MLWHSGAYVPKPEWEVMGTALHHCLLRLRKMSHSKGQQDTAQQPANLQQRLLQPWLQVKATAAHVFKGWFDPVCVSQPARAVSILFEPAGVPGQSTGKQALLPKRIYVPANTVSHTQLSISLVQYTFMYLGWSTSVSSVKMWWFGQNSHLQLKKCWKCWSWCSVLSMSRCWQ